MAKIKQLSSHEAQKIAAGEVVERPANIVKELIENSIDAGATRITIYIEDGGKKLIRIVDNGCGMDQTDAQICFDRHATSKIIHVDELESITTFGFRGEALASIASVSTITLITKEEHSLEGTKILINADNITHVNSVACATGTDITIQDLFANVPARRKFLKTTQTEWRAIQLLFNAFCFDYPHIHFFLFSDEKQISNCPAAINLKNRVLQIWERTTHNHLLEFTTQEHSFTIVGIISDHQYYRYDRTNIYFFVNQRWVKNQHLSNAFIKGYTNVLPNGRYPAAVIHITIPANEVDINIHPRKEEIKFLNPRRIEQALQQAVKTTLEKNLSQHLNKEVTFKSPSSYSPAHNFTPSFAQASADMPFDFDTSFNPLVSFEPAWLKRRMNETENLSNTYTLTAESINGENKQQISAPFDTLLQAKTLRASGTEITTQLELAEYEQTSSIMDSSPLALSAPVGSVSKGAENYRLIGQYNSTYILIEKEDGLFLIDQHAAHERILYELFSQRFSEVATVHLLFPHIITLPSDNIELISSRLDIFISNGIIIEQCASNQLIVQSLPVHLKNESIIRSLSKLIF